VVNDWDLLNSAGNPLSAITPATNNIGYQLKFNWTLSPSSTILNEGDTFSINRPTVPSSSGISWLPMNSGWINFSDNSGIV
jgi:hypothetical protein